MKYSSLKNKTESETSKEDEDSKPATKESESEAESSKTEAVNDVIAIIGKVNSLELIKCLHELCKFVDCFGKGHSAIVEEVVKIYWADKSREDIKVFEKFFLSVLSYHPYYTRIIIRSTLKMFIPDQDNMPKIGLDLIHQNLHHFLKKYLKKLKGERKELIKQVISIFPFFKAPSEKVVSYMRCLLEMVKYIPDRRSDILEIIFEKCIQIDAGISRPQLRKYCALKEKAEKGDDVGVDSGEGDSEDEDDGDDTVPLTEVDKRLCESLDQCMELLLNFILYKPPIESSETDKDPGSGMEGEENAKKLAAEVTANDTKRIFLMLMKTHLISSDKINSLQYTIFLLASSNKSYRQKMLSSCWDIFTTKTQHSIFRQAAISYLSGFLCRSRPVKNKAARKWLVKIINWIHDYLRLDGSNDLDYMEVNLDANGPFYSACQAAFYVIAFRHSDFVVEDDVSFLSNLELNSIITHPLNPLRAISSNVVKEFSKVTAFYQVCYCKNVILRNNRITLPVIGNSSSERSATATKLMLDKYFPFDPYLLSRTKHLVAPFYREHVASLTSESEVEEEKEEDEGSDQEYILESPKGVAGRRSRCLSSSSSTTQGRTRTISLTLTTELDEI